MRRNAIPASQMATASPPEPHLLFSTDWSTAPLWRAALEDAGLPVIGPEEAEGKWDNIVFAACWGPRKGLLQPCFNLRAVMSLGAGVDHIVGEGQVPEHVPLLRVVDPLMLQRMATWVVWAVTNYQRKMDEYHLAQSERRWDLQVEGRLPLDNEDLIVGIMGVGAMGQACAQALSGLGYPVIGWGRSKRERQGFSRLYWGKEELNSFLVQCRVLVCLLPLTPATEGIIDKELLGHLPHGCCIISAGRGRHVIEKDLLAALSTGQVSRAVLDVFQQEPLPRDSPFWNHPRVRITPHVASLTSIPNAVQQIQENYLRVLNGQPPLEVNLVDRQQGY